MYKRGLYRCAVSVCLSVMFVYSVEKRKHVFKVFSLSGSHTILVFPHQVLWQYSDGDTPNEGVEQSNAGEVDKNRDSRPISGFIKCCHRCDGQVLYTQLRRTVASW